MLIDCGATSLLALKQKEIHSDLLDLIVLSHFHGDHFGGIPFMLLDRYFNGDKNKPLTIIGPTGCSQRIMQLTEILYPGTNFLFEDMPVEVIDYSIGSTLEMGGVRIQPFEVVHSKPALPHALRIEVNGKTVAYSGDTEWTDILMEVATGADLFICECSTYNEDVPGHLSYMFLKEKVQRFNCKKILLTHLGQKMLDHISDISLECAEDGQCIIL